MVWINTLRKTVSINTYDIEYFFTLNKQRHYVVFTHTIKLVEVVSILFKDINQLIK